MKNFYNIKSGFTIIEVMISVALFSVIIIIGVGSLLNASNLHNKSAKVRSILDNLSFVMEDMSRNLRTGSDYSCEGGFDCTDGKKLIFINHTPGQSGEKWMYVFLTRDDPSIGDLVKIVRPSGTPNTDFDAILSAANTADLIPINPEEVQLDSSSGFNVTGADPNDPVQPYVTIKLSGKILYKSEEIPFKLQTSISQRLIDAPAN
ncbi:MAG: prepilin-type N-terminal cleavage/methylation domain-containing protein [Candidatus Nomurabacteria bacterium]|nr:prepilin-type N-terminal cleavage/methylation domain-containing protein [Candidatus Nomurabacteria bacterium]